MGGRVPAGHDRGKPRRSGHRLWDSITGVLRGLANALNALDYLVLALLLVALPFVYFARCVGIDGNDRAPGLPAKHRYE